MSRGAPNQAGLGPLGRILAIVAPAVTALTLVAIVALPPSEPDEELQLLAPERVPAGAIVPLRAHLYVGLGRAQGASLASAPVDVELRGPRSQLWARAALRTGFGATMEGAIVLPADRSGDATLIARASYQGQRVDLQRSLRIDAPGTAQALRNPPRARELPPLRSLALGPLRALGPAPPNAMDARVRGGACVPEAPCELLVHVGEPAATVFAEPSASVSAASTQTVAAPTTGSASLIVTAHGPEAELDIRAERNGVAIARRAVRLPLALGGNAFATAPDVLTPSDALQLALYGSERGCIVDAFLDGRWARTGSFRDCRAPARAPFAALEPGLWQVQLRRDPFSSESAAVRSIYVASPHEARQAIDTRLAREAIALDPDDGVARALVAQPNANTNADTNATATNDSGNTRYLLAVVDGAMYALPAPTSSYTAAVLQMQATRRDLRRLGLFALGCCALTLVALLGQRGLDAASDAAKLLAAAGSDPRSLQRARMRMVLRVVATLCALLLAFAAIAAYVVARAAAG